MTERQKQHSSKDLREKSRERKETEGYTDEKELPSESTFLPVTSDPKTSWPFTDGNEETGLIRHSTPVSRAGEAEFAKSETQLAGILSPIPTAGDVFVGPTFQENDVVSVSTKKKCIVDKRIQKDNASVSKVAANKNACRMADRRDMVGKLEKKVKVSSGRVNKTGQKGKRLDRIEMQHHTEKRNGIMRQEQKVERNNVPKSAHNRMVSLKTLDDKPPEREQQNKIDFKLLKKLFKKTWDELMDECLRLAEQIGTNKKAIMKNDAFLHTQDRELEDGLLFQDLLCAENERMKKKIAEVKKVNESINAEMKEQRVQVKTNLLGAQMYSKNSDITQEEIWKLREEITELEFMSDYGNSTVLCMRLDHLKEQLSTETQDNDKLERKIARLEKKKKQKENATDNTNPISKEKKKKKIKQILSKQGNNGIGERYVVLPKIHRRGQASENNNSIICVKTGPAVKMNTVAPLPPIGQQGQTNENVIKAIQTTSNQPDNGLCENSCNDIIAPRPPSTAKPEGKFTRKNILKKLKSLVNK